MSIYTDDAGQQWLAEIDGEYTSGFIQQGQEPPDEPDSQTLVFTSLSTGTKQIHRDAPKEWNAPATLKRLFAESTPWPDSSARDN